mmetsp:Transcript_2376/g.9181  ORF Transcript_2376/g.9181 Transcript_2376/m.9181 type:complete len:218 (-) Transcript_2376:2264-2917(-)
MPTLFNVVGLTTGEKIGSRTYARATRVVISSAAIPSAASAAIVSRVWWIRPRGLFDFVAPSIPSLASSPVVDPSREASSARPRSELPSGVPRDPYPRSTYDALDGVVRTRRPFWSWFWLFASSCPIFPIELVADRVAAYGVSPPHGASLHAHDPKLTGSHRNDASPSAEGRHVNNPPSLPGVATSFDPSSELRGNDPADPSTPTEGQNPAAASTSSS